MIEHGPRDVIDNRFELIDTIGTGGYSVVWKARDHQSDTPVALKVPRFDTQDRIEVLDRFKRERNLLEPFGRGLTHGTIVRFITGNLSKEFPYLAFEYLPGDPLVDAFGSGQLGSGLRRRIATDLAETLDFLHRNDIIYLDLKPENIILRRSGRPVLIDYNTAIWGRDQGKMIFSPDQFKAPEVLAETTEEGAAGPWSDVFSWGKLAFYLLTGAKIPTKNVPEHGLDPRNHGSTVSRDFAEVIQRATTPAIDARYTDGLTLADAVGRSDGRPSRMVVELDGTSVSAALRDGDEVGRAVPDTPVPWIVLADDDGHISPQHFTVHRSRDGWVLVDTSLNGTYLRVDRGWKYLLSEAGFRRRVQSKSVQADETSPPNSYQMRSGSIIAPVHPKYGIRLRVTNEN